MSIISVRESIDRALAPLSDKGSAITMPEAVAIRHSMGIVDGEDIYPIRKLLGYIDTLDRKTDQDVISYFKTLVDRGPENRWQIAFQETRDALPRTAALMTGMGTLLGLGILRTLLLSNPLRYLFGSVAIGLLAGGAGLSFTTFKGIAILTGRDDSFPYASNPH